MKKEVVALRGKKDGPVSVIMAGVHGDEPCGLGAFDALLPTLGVEAGKVYFVIGNPNAIADKVRFTEFDLNRAFRHTDTFSSDEQSSYEFLRAQYLKSFLDQSTALLDIHSGATAGSIPFAICEENGLEIAHRLPVELIASEFDKISPGGTDEYMNRTGKVGICIECGYHLDNAATRVAEQAIMSFLSARGHIGELEAGATSSKRRVLFDILYRSCGRLKLAKNWCDFEIVPAGSPICVDEGLSIRAESDSVIVFAEECDTAGKEAFYLGKEVI
jgi:predicted deacylase